jgi:outer membrane immunogenic protein
MGYVRIILAAAVVVGGGTHAASAQTAATPTWTGAYVGAAGGLGMVRKSTSETVTFDTNLDGTFTDMVRTSGGANAFAPGFCGGTAINATAAAGCTEDESRGYDFSGRLGYDWQYGRLIVGAVLEGGRTEAADAVTAFSVTPAFYTFTRELDYLAALRGRLGVGSDRMLIYATGGVASASVEHTFSSSNIVNTFVSRDTPARAWGFQAGGGIELRLAPRVSVSGEYLFTRLDDEDDATVRSQGPAPATNPFILVNAAGTDMQRSTAFQFQAIRVGVNLRF